ncbi:conserved hypothetical protein [Desulfosarcina cetonica]|uniref:hypothetical protein n=1 Tax=Desulfosarcina cetonica TaxID=90730 RepID=UPI0006D1610C|nr:hypothetical protein [Desulfosarcina cetonica]VTR69846.1 conserved hypothetical protein [Desulfosarcina cetonica]
MNELDSQTVTSATTLITDLLPDGEGPGFMPHVTIVPSRLGPVGVGGVVGILDDPHGDIRMHRLEGTAMVVIKASSPELLHDATVAASQSVLSTDRIALRRQGMYTLQTGAIGPVRQLGYNTPSTRYERDLELKIIFEKQIDPEEAGGVIAEIPQLVSLRPSLDTYETVVDVNLRSDVLSRFTVFDDPAAGANAPSDWRFDSLRRRTAQFSAIHGGDFAPVPEKPGTVLLLSDDTPDLSALALQAVCRSADQRAMGVVFRWQDIDNFYFFLMSRTPAYAMIAKKTGGTYAALDTSALNTDFQMEQNRSYTLTIDASGDILRAYVGTSLIVSGQDAAIPDAGSVGLMSFGNSGSYFYRLTATRPPA